MVEQQKIVLDLTEDGSQEKSDDVIMMESPLKSESSSKLSKKISKDDSNEVCQWLEGIKYSQYLTNFLEGGYDTLRHVLILTDKDLTEMKIKPPGHRKMLLIEAQNLASALGSALDESSSGIPPTVDAWLKQINYPDYLPSFLNAGYDEVRTTSLFCIFYFNFFKLFFRFFFFFLISILLIFYFVVFTFTNIFWFLCMISPFRCGR